MQRICKKVAEELDAVIRPEWVSTGWDARNVGLFWDRVSLRSMSGQRNSLVVWTTLPTLPIRLARRQDSWRRRLEHWLMAQKSQFPAGYKVLDQLGKTSRAANAAQPSRAGTPSATPAPSGTNTPA